VAITPGNSPYGTPFGYFQRAAEAAVSSLAIELVPLAVENAEADIERAIETFAEEQIDE
jgi:hypothetical protein